MAIVCAAELSMHLEHLARCDREKIEQGAKVKSFVIGIVYSAC